MSRCRYDTPATSPSYSPASSVAGDDDGVGDVGDDMHYQTVEDMAAHAVAQVAAEDLMGVQAQAQVQAQEQAQALQQE